MLLSQRFSRSYKRKEIFGDPIQEGCLILAYINVTNDRPNLIHHSLPKASKNATVSMVTAAFGSSKSFGGPLGD